jgi:hypothetical protein
LVTEEIESDSDPEESFSDQEERGQIDNPLLTLEDLRAFKKKPKKRDVDAYRE